MSEYQATLEQKQKWRQEFETYATKEGYKMERVEQFPDLYDWAYTALSWSTWQAARSIDAQRIAELEAGLSACLDAREGECNAAWLKAMNKARKLLAAAKRKGE